MRNMSSLDSKQVQGTKNGTQVVKNMVYDTARQVIDKHDNKVYKDGQQAQRDRDIDCAIRAFIELRQNDATIYELLEKYFGVETFRLASLRSFAFHKEWAEMAL